MLKATGAGRREENVREWSEESLVVLFRGRDSCGDCQECMVLSTGDGWGGGGTPLFS